MQHLAREPVVGGHGRAQLLEREVLLQRAPGIGQLSRGHGRDARLPGPAEGVEDELQLAAGWRALSVREGGGVVEVAGGHAAEDHAPAPLLPGNRDHRV